MGPAAALVLVDTFGCLFSVSVAGARNAVLFLGFPGILVCGHVLGLRITGMRLVSLTSRIRSGVPARFLDLLKFDFVHTVGTTVGPLLLAEHRLHHGWTWTWPDIAYIFLCFRSRERTIILSKLLVGLRCLSRGWLDTHW